MMPPRLHQKSWPTKYEWLAARRNYITASDAAALCGKSNNTIATVFADKVTPEDETKRNDGFLRIGHALESLNMQMAEEQTGRELFREPAYTLTICKDIPYMAATLDARQYDIAHGWGVYEMKWRGAFANKSVEEYWCQLQHQLLCTGDTWGSIGILDTSGKLEVLDFDRDNAFLEAYVALCADFWLAVKANTIPFDMDGSQAVTDAIKRVFPKDDGTEIMLTISPELDQEYVEAKEYVDGCKKLLNEAEKQLRAVENQIKAVMKDHRYGVLPNARYEFATVNRDGYEVKATSYRTLKRKERE